MLGGLSVPLKWGVAVPPDEYDHWATEDGSEADPADTAVPGLITTEPAEGLDEWGAQGEWNAQGEWSAWEGEAEPRFDMPRTGRIVPHSPAAG